MMPVSTLPRFVRPALMLLALLSMPATGLHAAGISYTTTIQPIFTSLCTPCHQGSSPDAGMNLVTNSYANTVNVNSGHYASYRIRPNSTSNSAIYHVVVVQGSGLNHQGLNWIASQTQKNNITDWINQGALPNTNAPTLTSLSPTSGVAAGNTTVTLTGTNFGGTGAFAPVVTFGGVAATNVVVTTGSFTQITCRTPPGTLGTANVQVTTTAGGASNVLTNGFTFNVGPASKLAFSVQPTSAIATASITPDIKVQIQDSQGNLTTSTTSVTLAIGTNPGGSTLSGTTTVAAVAGTATFSNLSLNNVGTSYTLTATATSLTGATSSTFSISSASPSISSATSAAIGSASATLGGNVTSAGLSTVTERGVVYAPTSLNSNPQIGGGSVTSAVALTAGTGVFTVNVTGLSPSTAYSFAAYATNSVGTVYTPVGSFTTKSDNANLAGLALSAGTLDPAFDSATLSYTASVPTTTASLTVTPTVADGTATVKVNNTAVASGTATGPVSLSIGINLITTVVTAQDGSTKTYVVAVTRLPGPTLDSLVLSNGTLSPAFDTGTFSYTATVPYATATITVTPTVTDITTTLKVNDVALDSGTESNAIPLSVGINIITVAVTSLDTFTTISYTLTITRVASSNADLASLLPDTGSLSPTFDPATISYTMSVLNTTTTLTLTPTVADNTATVKVNDNDVASSVASGAINLSVGSNVITVLVKAQNNATKTYTLTVNRAASSIADLASLTSTGALSPTFDSAVFSYAIDVPFPTSQVSFTPVAAESNAVIKINGRSTTSGIASAAVPVAEGDNTIAIVVTAQDGITTKTYTVTVHRAFSGAPRIVDQPAPQTVAPGASVTFSVLAVGADTLTYQWRRNGVIIGPATSSSFTINAVQSTDAGAYSVVVTNTLGKVTSDAAALTVAKPGVTGLPLIVNQPDSALVALGQTATFTAAATGDATLDFQWRKGTAPIALAKSTSYTTPPTTLTSAGSYNLQVKNGKGTVVSQSARLGVVSLATKNLPAKIGTNVTLTVSAAGDGLLYQWRKDGVEIADSTNGTHIISGTKTASLSIKVASTADSGSYTCIVRMGALSRESGANTLKVYYQAPVILLADNDALPTGIVSGSYSYQVPVNPSSDRAVVTFTTKPLLPAGLSINPGTGLITGKPTVASPAGTPFSFVITATNGVDKDSVSVKLTINALPPTAIGTFNGLVDRDASLTDGLSTNAARTHSFGGSLNVTTLAAGGFSGKLTLGGSSYSFVKQFLEAGTTANPANPSATVILARTPRNLTLTFSITKDTGELTGSVTDGVIATPVSIQAWRGTATALAATYTSVIDFTPNQLPNPDGNLAYPQGYGFGTLTVTAAGGATWSGRLSDGSVMTATTTVGSTGQIPLHFMLYTNTGAAHGWMQVSADTAPTINAGLPLLDGEIDWVKAPQAATSTNHNYKSGFPRHQLTIAGGKYVKPVTTVLGIVDQGLGTTNARLTFSQGGLTGPSPIVGATQATALNSTVFRITSTNAVVMPTTANNPTTLILKTWTPNTGAFDGTFVLKNDLDPTDHIGPQATLSRTVTFAGLLVPRLGINKGIGYFLLSKLPEDLNTFPPTKTTLATSDILSGQLELTAK